MFDRLLRSKLKDARLAVAAAGATVGHPGGRPALSPKAVQDQLSLLSGRITLDAVMGG
jgi:ribokinase